MEYCGGGDLSDIMEATRSCLSEAEIAVIFQDVLRGLAYLHENNKIHRDIKACNIILDEEGTAKLGTNFHYFIFS